MSIKGGDTHARQPSHRARNPLIAALTIALLFLGACAQKMETPATETER
jgi:hypothetical protein